VKRAASAADKPRTPTPQAKTKFRHHPHPATPGDPARKPETKPTFVNQNPGIVPLFADGGAQRPSML